MLISVIVNNKKHIWDVMPDEFLSETLRNNGYTSVKPACNDGACGSCTIFLNDKPIVCCEYLSVRADGMNITTIEGVSQEAEKAAHYLTLYGGEGCGYCAPGFVMQMIAMKRELKNPSIDEIRTYLSGNLCRCTGYLVRNEAAIAYLNDNN